MLDFLKNTYLCMEIGTNMVRLAEVAKKSNGVEILRTYVFDVPDDCTKDGKVRLTDEVIIAIKDGIYNSGIKADDVYFVVESTKILFKQVEIPKVNKNQIQNTLDLSFNDIFPVDEQLYHISYVLEKTYEKNGQKMMALDVFAVPNDLSSSYYDLSVALGLNAKGLTDPSRSIISLFPATFKGRNIAMVNIGENSSTLTITLDGDMVFNKTVGVGVADTIKLVADSPLSAEGTSLTTAAEFLFDQNILYKQMPEGVANPHSEEEILRYGTTRSIQQLVNVIESTFTAFLQKERITIQEFQLSGLGAGFSGISHLLTNSFGIPVSIIQQDGKLKINKTCADEPLLLSTYPAAGALIDSANFFTAEERAGGNVAHNKQVDKVILVIGVLSCLGSGTLSAASLLTANAALQEVQDEKNLINRHIEEMRALGAEKDYNDYELACAYEEEVLKLYEQTRTVNEDMCVFLEELEMLLPTAARVRTIDLNPTSANVAFICEDKYIAAGVLHRLRNMTTVSNFNCSGVSQDEKTNEMSFTCDFTLKTTEERRAEAIAAGLSEEKAAEIGKGYGYVPDIEAILEEERLAEMGETGENIDAGIGDIEDNSEMLDAEYMEQTGEVPSDEPSIETNEEMTEGGVE